MRVPAADGVPRPAPFARPSERIQSSFICAWPTYYYPSYYGYAPAPDRRLDQLQQCFASL